MRRALRRRCPGLTDPQPLDVLEVFDSTGAGQNGTEPEHEIHVEPSGEGDAELSRIGPEQLRFSSAIRTRAVAVLRRENEFWEPGASPWSFDRNGSYP
jgi:hypothetical protein